MFDISKCGRFWLSTRFCSLERLVRFVFSAKHLAKLVREVIRRFPVFCLPSNNPVSVKFYKPFSLSMCPRNHNWLCMIFLPEQFVNRIIYFQIWLPLIRVNERIIWNVYILRFLKSETYIPTWKFWFIPMQFRKRNALKEIGYSKFSHVSNDNSNNSNVYSFWFWRIRCLLICAFNTNLKSERDGVYVVVF